LSALLPRCLPCVGSGTSVNSKDTDVPEDVTSTPPFAGVRVLDFSGHFAAAMAAMHLGDLGAEVIKIDPSAEERGRREPGYLAWNRNKERLVLDLARASD